MSRNIQIREPGNNYADVLHPETNTDMVLLPDGVTPMTAHLADYVLQIGYATTTGSANNYAVTLNPAPASLVEGLCVAVKIHVTNTGTSTLNVNGKGAKTIKKPNGNNLVSGNLKAGSIYTVRYNGTNFILQGSDSTGNATPEHVLAGKTFSNDAGTELTGTMPNNGSQSATLTISGSSKPSKTIPAGYTTGGTVTAQVNINQASHIEAGYSLGGCVGTYKGKYIVDDLTDVFSIPSRSGDDRCGGGIDNDYVYFTGRDGYPSTGIVRFNHSGTMISSANTNLVNSYYGGTFNVHGAVFASGGSRDIYIYNASGTMIKTITLAATPQGSYRGVGYTLGRVLYVTNDPLICLDDDSGTRIASKTLDTYYGGFISNFNNTVVFSLIEENKERGGGNEYAGRVYYVPENGNTITKLNEKLRFMHININMLKKFFV